MGKIFIVIGKSASGKDYIYSRMIGYEDLGLKPLVIYTTRPMRSGEVNGREYHFTDVDHMNELEKAGRIIEKRVYPTIHGDWYYFTADEGQFSEENTYLGIGTVESFVKLKAYFGEERVIPIYIECEDGVRLQRAKDREAKQAKPSYKEVCRRYLADEVDFAEEKLIDAGISRRFDNTAANEDCITEAENYILENK